MCVCENNQQSIANKLNAFFIESIKSINDSIITTGINSETHTVCNSIFKFKHINVNDIKSAIKQIKSKGDLNWLRPDILELFTDCWLRNV